MLVRSLRAKRTYPDVEVANDSAVVAIQKDLAYVLVTFTELKSASGYLLKVDGKELDQSVH